MNIEIKKKPSRKDLIKVIEKLQHLIGRDQTYHGNDRNPNGFELGQKCLTEAFNLCLDAR